MAAAPTAKTAFNKLATQKLHTAAAEDAAAGPNHSKTGSGATGKKVFCSAHLMPAGDLQGVVAALSAGAHPSALNPEDDNPPLIAATSAGHTQVVQHLLAHGAKAHQARPSDEKHALHVAAEEGHLEIARVLLAQPSSPHAPTPLVLTADMDGWLPLHWAAYYGDAQVASLLLDSAKDVVTQQIKTENYAGQTPLDVCLQMCGSKWQNDSGRCCDFPALIRLLHQHGADVSGWRSLRSGGTALHEVVREGGESGCVTTLVELGTPVNATTSDSSGGVTALHLAVASGAQPLVAALLAAGASVEVVEEEGGATPLLLAAQSGSADLVECLLQHKADACARDGRGLTMPALLLLAHQDENEALPGLTLVLDYCSNQLSSLTPAPATTTTPVPTALHVAASKGWARAVAALLQVPKRVIPMTGSVANQDHQGDTPLHAALRGLRDESCVPAVADVVSLLLKAGADPAASNAAGKRPAELARWSPLVASTCVDQAVGSRSDSGASSTSVEELVAMLKLSDS